MTNSVGASLPGAAPARETLIALLLESNNWETGAKLNQKFTGREAIMMAEWLIAHGVSVGAALEAGPTEPIGTFACPICGVATPHSHTEAEIENARHDSDCDRDGSRGGDACCDKFAEYLRLRYRGGEAGPSPADDKLFQRVRHALWTWGQHKSFCHYKAPQYDDDIETDQGTPCDCGLHVEMEASRGVRGESLPRNERADRGWREGWTLIRRISCARLGELEAVIQEAHRWSQAQPLLDSAPVPGNDLGGPSRREEP